MESALMPARSARHGFAVLCLCSALSLPFPSHGGEAAESVGEEETGRLRLQKVVGTRDFDGKPVEGEERTVGPLDSLWRMLILEKELPEKNFRRYLVLVTALNPQLKDPDILPLGSTVFIPLRPDETLGLDAPRGQTQAGRYRVKAGDYVYKILREELGIRKIGEIETAFGELKRLNPRKTKWDLLLAGEILIVPATAKSPEPERGISTRPIAAAPAVKDPRKIPARSNLDLLEQVVRAFGSEFQRSGEERLPLQDANIHIDRSAYPVVLDPRNSVKVILDPGGTIPGSLKARLESRNSPARVFSLGPGASLDDAVNGLIVRLGFQPLPAGRPIVLQDHGLGIHLKGEWVAAPPEGGGGQHALWIVHLADGERTPYYLQEYLSRRGMNLREVLLPDPGIENPSSQAAAPKPGGRLEVWPRESRALVDAFLQSYPVSTTADHRVVLSLHDGIRMDIKIDRLFDLEGKRFAVFFQRIEEEVKRALEKEEKATPIELELGRLSARELIARLAAALGEKGGYREHRFSATDGASKDRLVLAVNGFLFPSRSILMTDREIPKDLHQFFFDRGLRIVYF